MILSRSAKAASRTAAAAVCDTGQVQRIPTRGNGGNFLAGILTQADGAGWIMVGLGKGHHFLKFLATVIALIFV
jgi:hypothetical protein